MTDPSHEAATRMLESAVKETSDIWPRGRFTWGDDVDLPALLEEFNRGVKHWISNPRLTKTFRWSGSCDACDEKVETLYPFIFCGKPRYWVCEDCLR